MPLNLDSSQTNFSDQRRFRERRRVSIDEEESKEIARSTIENFIGRSWIRLIQNLTAQLDESAEKK